MTGHVAGAGQTGQAGQVNAVGAGLEAQAVSSTAKTMAYNFIIGFGFPAVIC
jgi:hypothetical protein